MALIATSRSLLLLVKYLDTYLIGVELCLQDCVIVINVTLINYKCCNPSVFALLLSHPGTMLTTISTGIWGIHTSQTSSEPTSRLIDSDLSGVSPCWWISTRNTRTGTLGWSRHGHAFTWLRCQKRMSDLWAGLSHHCPLPAITIPDVNLQVSELVG
jgi:hypothetical protein